MIFFVIHLVLRTREPDLRNRSLRKADRTLVSPISKKNAGNSQACWRLLLHYPSFSGATAGHFSRFCVLQRRSGKENRRGRQRLPLESVDKAGTEPSDTLAHLDCGRRVAMGDSLLAGQVAKIRSVQMIFASPDKRRRLREPPRSLAQRQNKRFQSPCRLHRTNPPWLPEPFCENKNRNRLRQPYPQTNRHFTERTRNLVRLACDAVGDECVRPEGALLLYFSVSRYCILRLWCPEYETVLSIPTLYL